MIKTNKNERQSRGIKRTICIGLGGTGRDVLMRIRRLIVDRYGDLKELPIISFLDIDTDKAAFSTSDLTTGSTYHGVDLTFREGERIAATMNRTEVNNFIRGIERRQSYEREGPYDHIGRWFPPQLLKDIKAIEEGAKGIRPVGRLAFFNNYRCINNAIKLAENRTLGHQASLIAKGLVVEGGLDVFLVGSLCGGTGSGMFLDLAYILRQKYGDIGAKIFGYLVISPELYGNTPSMNANTYAALKELNHYATTGTKFEACYDPQNLAIVQEYRPPFDYVYLISHQTEKEYKITEKSKLCNVIARKIALDCFGELAPVIKGMRDNFMQHTIARDLHPRPNIQKYLTFGLAEIYFPRNKIVQIALNRISLKLLNFWLYGEGQSPDSQELLERFLINWNSNLSGQYNIFTSKLEEASIDGNKTFSSAINSWKKRLDNEISEIDNKDDHLAIKQQLSRKLRQQFRTVQPGENESTRGIWLTRVQQVSPNIKEEFKRDIHLYLQELLNPENEYFSITVARAWLEALMTKLNQYAGNLEEVKQSLAGMYSSDDAEKHCRQIEEIIEEIESKSGWLRFDRDRKTSQVKEQAKRSVEKIANLSGHNFEYSLTVEGIKIVKELQKYLRKISSEITDFNSLILKSIEEYEKEENELRQLNFDDEMSGEAIFSEGDIEACYQIIIPEEENRSQLVFLSKKVAERIVGETSLTGFINQRLDDKELQKEINETVDSIFGSRSLNLVQSVIKRFVENYSIPTERSTRLAQIRQESSLLLPLDLHAPYFYDDAGKKIEIIAFKDIDDRAVKQFKNTLLNDVGFSESAITPIQAEDEVTFVREYAGFPLRLLKSLPQMRQQYIRQQNYGSSFLHNDYATIFIDIIPPDARKIEELEDVFYPCLALDLLEYNPETRRFEFQYYDRLRGSYHTACLSLVWSEALETLSTRQDMTEELTNKLENAILEIEKSPSSWEEYHLPKLQEFVRKVDDLKEEAPNYPYKSAVIGTRGTIDTRAKTGIIERFCHKIEARLNSKILLENPGDIVEQKSIPGEIVIDNNTTNGDNRSKRREEIKLLKQDLEDGIITEEEYEDLRKKILEKYPI